MKYKIFISVLFTIFSVICFGQQLQFPSAPGSPTSIPTAPGGTKSKLYSWIPVKDTLNNLATIYVGAVTVRPQDTLISDTPPMYMSNGRFWFRLGGSGGGSGNTLDSIHVNSDSSYYQAYSGGIIVFQFKTLLQRVRAGPNITFTYTNDTLIIGSTGGGGSSLTTSFSYIVLDSLNTLPASPLDSSKYQVGTVPLGVAIGHANSIATYDSASATYTFQTPQVGDLLYNANNVMVSQWTGLTWIWVGRPVVHSVTGVGVDNTDPLNPVITSSGGGGSQNLQQTTDLGNATTRDILAYNYTVTGDGHGVDFNRDSSGLFISTGHSGLITTDFSSGSMFFQVSQNSGFAGGTPLYGPVQLIINPNSSVTLGGYGAGVQTGTATFNLSVDGSGNIIETAIGGGGGSGSTLQVAFDSSVAAGDNPIIALGGNKFNISQSGSDMVSIDPTAGNQIVTLSASDPTGGGNDASLAVNATPTTGNFFIEGGFNSGAQQASISGSADASTSLITITAATNTINGNIEYNGNGKLIVSNTLDLNQNYYSIQNNGDNLLQIDSRAAQEVAKLGVFDNLGPGRSYVELHSNSGDNEHFFDMNATTAFGDTTVRIKGDADINTISLTGSLQLNTVASSTAADDSVLMRNENTGVVSKKKGVNINLNGISNNDGIKWDATNGEFIPTTLAGSAWGFLGNTGVAGSYFQGTTNAVSSRYRTNNVEFLYGDSSSTAAFKKTFISDIFITKGAGANYGSIGIGDRALYVNTTGYNNVSIGDSALMNNTTGYENVFIGSGAGNGNTTGQDAVGIGIKALFSQAGTYGSNTAVGAYSQQSTNAGYHNSSFGYLSMNGNTSGLFNTGIGDYTIQTSSTASNKTAVGAYSQWTNSGANNVSVGYQSLQSGSGTENTAIGYQSMLGTPTGNYNSAIGSSSLYNLSSGNSNMAVGRSALFNLLNGSYTVGIGESAGQFAGAGATLNKKPDSSVFIGYSARPLLDSQRNQIVISGYTGVGLGSNTTLLGNSATVTTGIWGDLKLQAIGNTLFLKEGTNAAMGVSTLVAGTATVSTTKVTANSRILLTVQSLGTVSLPTVVGVTARSAGTSFTITSASITDTSVIAWIIIEPG